MVKMNESGNAYQVVDGIYDALLETAPGTAEPKDLVYAGAMLADKDPMYYSQNPELLDLAAQAIREDVADNATTEAVDHSENPSFRYPLTDPRKLRSFYVEPWEKM